jgi:hypothetical protein
MQLPSTFRKIHLNPDKVDFLKEIIGDKFPNAIEVQQCNNNSLNFQKNLLRNLSLICSLCFRLINVWLRIGNFYSSFYCLSKTKSFLIWTPISDTQSWWLSKTSSNTYTLNNSEGENIPIIYGIQCNQRRFEEINSNGLQMNAADMTDFLMSFHSHIQKVSESEVACIPAVQTMSLDHNALESFPDGIFSLFHETLLGLALHCKFLTRIPNDVCLLRHLTGWQQSWGRTWTVRPLVLFGSATLDE